MKRTFTPKIAGSVIPRKADNDAGALRYLHEQNIDVPNQVQLFGFGDTELGNVVTPSISSVHFHYKTTGMESARLLLEILKTDSDMGNQIKMGYQITPKASTR